MAPKKIQAARKELEKICEAAAALTRPREKLLADAKENLADVSDLRDLLSKHTQLLDPTEALSTFFREAVDSLKKTVKEALANAKANDNLPEFKKEKWYTDHQELLDDLANENTSLSTVKTELKHYISDLERVVARLEKTAKAAAQGQKKKTAAAGSGSKQAEPLVELEANLPSAQDWSATGTMSQFEDTAPSRIEAHPPPSSYHTPNAPPQEHYAQALTPPSHAIQHAASVSSASSQHDLSMRELTEKIAKLNHKVEELKSEKKEYKKKYQEQKKLTATAEAEVQRLKESTSRGELNQEQQKAIAKAEANHQELLQLVRQGFSDVTIEILRSTRH